MSRHIVLLRGVNLGPHRRLAMADVRTVLGSAGFEGVVTHLASGNVVLDSDLAPDAVAAGVRAALADELALRTDVIVRSPAELTAAMDADPLREIATDPARHVLGFLASAPDPDRVARLEERIAARPSDGDRHAFDGRHFYLWCPNGISRSPYFSVPWDNLGVRSTQRNWNTVTALARLAGG